MPVLNNSFFKLATTVLLLVAASYAGVNVSSPTNGSTVGSPVHVVASSTSSNPITAMKVYVDNNIAYSVSAASINTYLNLASGTRYITIQSWDSTGLVQKNSMAVNVSGTTTTTSSDTASTSSTGVVVNSPTGGSTVGSPTTISATGGSSISTMQIYVDGSLKYSVGGRSVNTSLSLAGGSHTLVAQGWDSSGHYYKSPGTSFNVGGGSTSTTPTTSGTPKYPNVQAMTGWQNCGACAGPGGTGPTVPYSLTQWISNPSMDGKTAQFWIGGSTRYAQALWWKQLGANDGVSNFVYDLYFYLKDPNAPQALEFDVNQSLNGLKYIFGTECNYKQTGTWRIWDTKNAYWVNTGVACPKPAAYAWNHLTWEMKRVGNQTLFVAVTLNGVKHYINRYFYAQSSGAHELNVAFQMDENGYPTQYSTWLDKVSLNAW